MLGIENQKKANCQFLTRIATKYPNLTEQGQFARVLEYKIVNNNFRGVGPKIHLVVDKPSFSDP